MGRLKPDIEVFISRVARNFFNSGLPDVFAEILLYITNTLINVLGTTLGKHLNRTIRKVADKATQAISIGYAVCREPKPHPLHSTDENYMSGDLIHRASYINQTPFVKQDRLKFTKSHI